MSFMPNVGTVVRLDDGRVGVVSRFTPTGDDDRILFAAGHEERSDAGQIAEMLSPEPELSVDPASALADYLARAS
jgi:hypothetical protein